MAKSPKKTAVYVAPERQYFIKKYGADRYSVKMYYYDKDNPIYTPSIKREMGYFDEFGNGRVSITISEPKLLAELLANKTIKKSNPTLEELMIFIQSNLYKKKEEL